MAGGFKEIPTWFTSVPILVLIGLGCDSGGRAEKGIFCQILLFLPSWSWLKKHSEFLNPQPHPAFYYMTTCLKVFHVKFPIAATSATEEDARGVGLISNFGDFSLKKRFLWCYKMTSHFFRGFKGGCDWAKFGSDPKYLPLFVPGPKLAQMCLATKANFSAFKNWKKLWRHWMMAQKPFIAKNSKKIPNWSDSTGIFFSHTAWWNTMTYEVT